MILVVARDLDGFPRQAECSICESTGVQPAGDRDGSWLLDWAGTHPCVAPEIHDRSVTSLR